MPTPIDHLPMRTRHLVRPSEPAVLLRTVHCPVRCESVPIVECDLCERCVSIHVAKSDHDSQVSCRTGRAHKSQPGWNYLMHKVLPSLAACTPLADVVSGSVTCLTADVALDDAVSLFLGEGLDAAPVVDHDGYPFGMITKTDLLREIAERGVLEEQRDEGPSRDGIDGACHVVEPTRRLVSDVMAPLAFTLCETDTLLDAAGMMETEGVHALPVVDGSGRVVGLFSAADFGRWLIAERRSSARR
jgi:CBS domain-containing protein